MSPTLATAAEVDSAALDAFLRRFFSPAKCRFLAHHGEWWHRGAEHQLVLFAGEDIAAYCAVMPARCGVAGEVLAARWWIDLVVAPEYRGRGYESLLDRRVREPGGLVLGFPNQLAARIHRRHGWGVDEDHRVMLLPLVPAALRAVRTATGVGGMLLRFAARAAGGLVQPLRWRLGRYRPVTARPAELDPVALAGVFARSRPASLVTTWRDADHLAWRYAEAPYRDELCCVVAGPATPSVAAILRLVETPQGRVARLLDLFGDLDDRSAVIDVLRWVAREALARKSVQLTAFVSLPRLRPAFRAAGLFLAGRARSCWLHPDAGLMQRLAAHPRHWCLGDSDHDEPG